jgi:DNA polymerase-1
MPTLVLVDGSSYLYRAFHALPDLRTRTGEPTGALRGVVSMLRRIVEDSKPDRFAVVFDAPGKTFRDDWYPQYKATRTPMADDLARQIEPLHELVTAHGWPLIVIEGVEADDVIGTLANRARDAGYDVVVSTQDKDLAQLVRSGVTLVNTMSNETLDEEGVVAKFGVRADQVLDLLTLVGDAIDNVPGVPKVGPKTAAKWLSQYGTLDGVIAHASDIAGVVGDNLRATVEWLPQGKRLLTVRTDCALPVTFDELKLSPPDIAKLASLFERFEFKSWLKDGVQTTGRAADMKRDEDDVAGRIAARAAGMTGRQYAAQDEPARAPRPHVPRHYEIVQDEAALARWIAAIERAELVSFDTETTGVDQMQAKIVGLSFAVDAGCACYVPLTHRYAGVPAQLDADATLARLAKWYADPAKKKVGQNVKYDEHVLANHGIALAGVAHDTLLESYVIESHKPHDMDNLAWRWLDVKTLGYDDVTGKGANRIEFDQVAIERAAEYACEDADVTLQVHRVLHPRIEEDEKLARIYSTIEVPVREVLFRMERNGVLIDSRLLADQGRALAERVLALEQRAYALAGQPFNLGSPKQLCDILFT